VEVLSPLQLPFLFLKGSKGLLKWKQQSAWNIFPEYETATIPQSLADECRRVAAARLQVWLSQGRLELR